MSLQQFWDQYVVHPNERYRLSGTLSGHKAAINCMSFLQEDMLASGGDDQTIRIWDLRSQKISQTFSDPGNKWGQVTAMVASDTAITGGTTLFCGTGHGHVVVFKIKKKKEFQKLSISKVFDADSVEAIAYDPIHHRLACTSHNGKLRVLRLEREGTLGGLFNVDNGKGIPRAVIFGNGGQRITIHCLKTGEQISRTCEGEDKNIQRLQSPIGNLDLCPRGQNIVIDNMTSGYDLYPIDRTTPTRSFEIPNGQRYVKMVKFAEKGDTIVGGSDHGCVYVFKISDSDPIQVLYHERAERMIQTIATFSSREEDIIASGSSDGGYKICLWRKPSKREAARPASAWHSFCESIKLSAFAIVVVALYMGWRIWAPVVVDGLQSISRSVQDGVMVPQPGEYNWTAVGKRDQSREHGGVA